MRLYLLHFCLVNEETYMVWKDYLMIVFSWYEICRGVNLILTHFIFGNSCVSLHRCLYHFSSYMCGGFKCLFGDYLWSHPSFQLLWCAVHEPLHYRVDILWEFLVIFMGADDNVIKEFVKKNLYVTIMIILKRGVFIFDQFWYLSGLSFIYWTSVTKILRN